MMHRRQPIDRQTLGELRSFEQELLNEQPDNSVALSRVRKNLLAIRAQIAKLEQV